MCGIVGALTFDAFSEEAQEIQRTEAAIFITTQLLQSTVERGKDATGIALLWADGNYSGLKMGIPSPSFIARFGDKESEFKGMLKLWRSYKKPWKVFLGHCRKASKGNSYDNKNNHPLQVGDVLYIHNGTLNNDDEIFEKLNVNRAGEVDSEAIGHLLHHYTNNGTEPFTKEAIDEVTRRLDGTYSVIACSGNNPYQVAQFRDGRPAELVLVKPLKTVFVASDKKFLENVLFEYNKMVQLFLPAGGELPYLKKDDVEFKTMVDDSSLIWDLTLPINEETTIDDLYDWNKTPLRVDKIWKATTTTYSGNNNYNAYNASKKTVAATSVGNNGTTKSCTNSTDSDPESSGLVWSKGLNKYKTQSKINETKKYGAIEIDIDKGELTHLEPDTLDEEDEVLNEVEQEKVENLLAGQATIQELAQKNLGSAVSEVKKTSESQPKSSANEALVEIDMTTNPDATKAANEFVEEGLPKFENDEEVVEALELNDASVLRALPAFALTNRLAKMMAKGTFVAGFLKGAESRKIAGEMPAIDKRKTKKLESSEKSVRASKLAVKILAQALHDQHIDTKFTLSEAVKKVMGDKEVRVDLNMAFSVGDLRNIPLLKELNESLKGEEESKS